MKDNRNIDISAILAFFKSLHSTIINVQSSIDDLNRTTSNLRKAISEYFAKPDSIGEKIKEAIRNIQEYYEKIPDVIRYSMLVLAEQGWYLNINMTSSVVLRLQAMVYDGKNEEVDNLLMEYFNGKIVEIEEELVSNHVRRSTLLHAAFKAHRRGEYELSIPVLIAQADGICSEVIGYQLFRKDRKGSPYIAKYVKEIVADKYKSAFLFPFTQDLPIHYSERKRNGSFSALNRHQVLHGESVNYGTRLNSFKAISLVYYISTVLNLSNVEDES
jgi:hypothetical protein